MDTGGKIRTGKLLEKLKDTFDITLISNVESPKDDPYLDRIKNLCAQFHPVPWKEASKYSCHFYLKILVRAFSRYPVTVLNDYSAALERKIEELVEHGRYDLLICDFLQSSLNFRRVVGHPTVLFQHNVESTIAKRHFERAGSQLSKCFWWSQWQKMLRHEKKACSFFDGVIAVSEGDKAILEKEFGAKNVFAIPTGIDTMYFSSAEEAPENDTLIFTGSMDWLPNQDAILFFARDILGRIKAVIPRIKLAVVGRNPSARLVNELKQYPEIDIVGRVEDVRPFISRNTLFIIPLRIGGGTRIKVYEAMSMGKAVISTSVGVEGLPVRHGEHVMVADKPEDFAGAVVALLKDVQARRRLEISARNFVENNFSWELTAKVFENICRHVAGVGALSADRMSLKKLRAREI